MGMAEWLGVVRNPTEYYESIDTTFFWYIDKKYVWQNQESSMHMPAVVIIKKHLSNALRCLDSYVSLGGRRVLLTSFT